MDNEGHGPGSPAESLKGGGTESRNAGPLSRFRGGRSLSPEARRVSADLPHRRSDEPWSFHATRRGSVIGGPERTRTSDLRFRKPLLYPAELRDLKLFQLLTIVTSAACRPGCTLGTRRGPGGRVHLTSPARSRETGRLTGVKQAMPDAKQSEFKAL